MRRRSLLVAAAAALAGCGGGDEASPAPDDDDGATPEESPAESPLEDPGELTLTSPAFDDGEPISEEYTCDGADVSPPLTFDGVPEETDSFALVLDDPDAPQEEPFVHWLLWNLPGDAGEIPEEVASEAEPDGIDVRQGTNSFDDVGYGGPCPPEDDDAHVYRFQLFALVTTLDLEAGAERDELESAMEDNVVGDALLRGQYERG